MWHLKTAADINILSNVLSNDEMLLSIQMNLIVTHCTLKDLGPLWENVRQEWLND